MSLRLPPVTPARAAQLVFSCLLLGSCTNPQSPPAVEKQDAVVANQSVSTQEILLRCAEAHSRGRTFHIIGVLKDNRAGKRKVVPLAWDYQRPNRSRLQIDMSVAVVLGQSSWIYTPERGHFVSLQKFTRTPVQTASFLVSDGIAMLLPELWAGSAIDQSGNWHLEGVAWSSGRPCYVLSQAQVEEDRPRRLLLWIDQGDFLLREWAIMVQDRNGEERPIVGCDFNEIVVNGPMSEQSFRLDPPEPLSASNKKLSTEMP